jgi:hypothetical protein
VDVVTGFKSMCKPVGGRGKVAPYVSTHVRIPEDIKGHVELLKEMYHDGILPSLDSFTKLINQDDSKINCSSAINSLPSLDDVNNNVRAILLQKKSARVSLGKLIDFIYGKDR